MSLSIGEGSLCDPFGEEMYALYPQIALAYARAFGEDPDWNEKSKCPSLSQAVCVGGLSGVAVGDRCNNCGLKPIEPAYPQEELITGFKNRAETDYSVWYTETVGGRLAMAAFAWRATAARVAAEKYPDNAAMDSWLRERVGEGLLVWLDEVFADKNVRADGNLRNFVPMVRQLGRTLGMIATDEGVSTSGLVVFRTKKGAMLSAARRLSGTKVYESAKGEVPDRRDLVVMNTAESGSK